MLESHFQSELIEAGCDEAGRGCLAGPVFGAAVILPKDFFDPHLNDSKKITQRQRDRLRILIEQEAIAWAVAQVSPQRIDQINILNAAHESMGLAAEALSTKPELLLIDGNLFRYQIDIPHKCIIGGDAKYSPIAAASILAKTHRDEYMLALAQEYPQYSWHKGMGYPTAAHRKAIAEYGVTPHHRLTFKL